MSETQGDLARQLRQGEQAAVIAVARIARSVVGTSSYVIPRGDGEDLVQEVVVQVYRAACDPDFIAGRDFPAFVRTIAHRRCVDWIRRRHPAEEIDPESASDQPAPDVILIRQERIERGRAVLRLLAPSCVRLIRLRAYHGLPYREIAERLGQTEDGVRARMYKCLKRAKALLRREVHPDDGMSRAGED